MIHNHIFAMSRKQIFTMSLKQSKISATSSFKLLRVTYTIKNLVFDSTKLSGKIYPSR